MNNRARLHCVGLSLAAWLIFIAVAVALLLVGFIWINSRNKAALQAISLRNLQQWGIALNLYLVENEDRLPEVGGAVASPDAAKAWYNALPESIGQTALTRLTPEEKPKPGQESLWIDPATTPREVRTSWGDYFFSFGMNYWLQPSPREAPWKIYNLSDPSRTVFLAPVSGPRPGAAPSTVVYRYGTRGENSIATVLFCDGHAAAMTRPELSGIAGSGTQGGTAGTQFAEAWRPFPGAPQPEYDEVLIPSLPEEETSEDSPPASS